VQKLSVKINRETNIEQINIVAMIGADDLPEIAL